MASNYTTNYQLNQWEPTDPVFRTDFNVRQRQAGRGAEGSRQPSGRKRRLPGR